jgi:hypothetical protein
MRPLISIAAVIIMFLALSEMAISVILFASGGVSSQQGDAKAERREFLPQLRQLCQRLNEPGTLFCYAAVVFVLVRISVVQEEDAARAPLAVPAPPPPRSSPRS